GPAHRRHAGVPAGASPDRQPSHARHRMHPFGGDHRLPRPGTGRAVGGTGGEGVRDRGDPVRLPARPRHRAGRRAVAHPRGGVVVHPRRPAPPGDTAGRRGPAGVAGTRRPVRPRRCGTTRVPAMTPPSQVRRIAALRAAAPIALLATVHLLAVELLRAATPLLDLASARIGVVGAAGVATVLFVAPVLPAAVVGRLAPVPAVAGTVGLVLLLRLVAQAQDPATLAVVGAGAAAAVAALVVSVRVARDGVAAAVGILLGTVADLALRTAFATWDPIVRPGVVPWLVVAVEAVLAVGALALLRRWDTTAGPPLRRRWALGPYLALYVLGFGSAPIAAAHGGVPLPLAGAVLVVAAVGGVGPGTRMRLPGGSGAVPARDRWRP